MIKPTTTAEANMPIHTPALKMPSTMPHPANKVDMINNSSVIILFIKPF
jgi:hypothetical protein